MDMFYSYPGLETLQIAKEKWSIFSIPAFFIGLLFILITLPVIIHLNE